MHATGKKKKKQRSRRRRGADRTDLRSRGPAAAGALAAGASNNESDAICQEGASYS